MTEPRELNENNIGELFGQPKPEPQQSEPERAPSPEPSDEPAPTESPPETPPAETVDPLIEHLRDRADQRGALTGHLLAERERPEPTGLGEGYYGRKREQQRELIDSLHEERFPGTPPIETRYVDYREGPEPAGEPRPPEFQPPYPEPD